MYPYQQTYYPQLRQPQQGIQYVNNRQSAEAYQLAPNSSVILMDANLSHEPCRVYAVRIGND